MHKILSSVLAASLTLAAASALAASQMKPGLWEMTIKSDAMKNMPKMSPEQIQQMKKMGVEMPDMSKGMVSKVCITKDMAERDDPAEVNKDMGCQTRNFKKAGDGYTADYVCNGKDMKGEGKISGSYKGNESFVSNTSFKGTMHGQPVDNKQETSGKWLAADCGSVKPVGAPQKK